MFGTGAGREATLLELPLALEEARPSARIDARIRGSGDGRSRFLEPSGECVVFSVVAPLAQSAERLHGKEKVYGSIP